MKKNILMAIFAITALGVSAKDIKTMVVTTTPVMHCESCENKIKDNLRFEKGIKRIETSVPDQTVTITYDADKNTADKIMAAFGKFGYEAKSVQAVKKACGAAETCGKKCEKACEKKADACGKCAKK